jgi:hypothetical protein
MNMNTEESITTKNFPLDQPKVELSLNQSQLTVLLWAMEGMLQKHPKGFWLATKSDLDVIDEELKASYRRADETARQKYLARNIGEEK